MRIFRNSFSIEHLQKTNPGGASNTEATTGGVLRTLFLQNISRRLLLKIQMISTPMSYVAIQWRVSRILLKEYQPL